MLHALMDGRALTATELARAAGITPQSASDHLARMTAMGLLTVEKQGHHRIIALRRFGCAHDGMHLECIMNASCRSPPPDRKRLIVGPRDAALRKARTYYDHFAGQLGVALADALVEQGRIGLTNDAGMLGVGFRSASAMSGSFEGERCQNQSSAVVGRTVQPPTRGNTSSQNC